MNELDDLQLRRGPDEITSVREQRRRATFWIPAVLLVLGAVAATYVLFGRRDGAIGTSTPATKNGPAPRESVAVKAADIDVPPLDDTDALVRQLVAALSSHPKVAAWLTTDDLIRNFTAVVHDVSAGMTPAARLKVLTPGGSFHPDDRDGDLRIDPQTYARYNDVADAVASVNAAGAAQLYATLKPRIEEAYAEQGFPHVPFDRTLEGAIVHLLQTPVVTEAPALEARGADVFAYADSRLESLSPAQKHLLRMGPRNVRLVQAKLREIAAALGIAADRLPSGS